MSTATIAPREPLVTVWDALETAGRGASRAQGALPTTTLSVAKDGSRSMFRRDWLDDYLESATRLREAA